ncbi:glycosyltransferase [Flavobacterium sp.]|uniref:glycosyltransferase n=1 Tax=Flavobacterium sp. TaxID=239 RepID=UPI0031D2DE6A
MKKKCLIIIPGIPYPPVDGHKLKIYNLILILSKHLDLHIITISKENISEKQAEFINQNSYKSKHFKLNTFFSLFRLFGAIFLQIPFQVKYFTLNSVRKYIKKEAKNDELTVLNLIRTCEYIDVLKDKSIIIDMVDALSKSYLKSKETTSSLIFNFIYGIETDRLVKYEKKSLLKANLTLCVNRDDALQLSNYGKVKWLPNGVNEVLFNYTQKSNQYNNCIVFFGAMFYQPNIDAVVWFEKHVMDYLNPDIKLIIIGPRPSSSVLNIAKKRTNVVVTGFLDDPYLIINSCFAVIAPMQNGGGIQNKILETMGMGKINVLTSYASDPIVGAENNKHFVIENDPLSMAKKINEIYLNPSSFIKIGEDAAIFIKNKYTWGAYERESISLIKELSNE